MDEGETGQNTGYIPVLVYTKSQAWHSEDSPGSPLAGDGRVCRAVLMSPFRIASHVAMNR